MIKYKIKAVSEVYEDLKQFGKALQKINTVNYTAKKGSI